MNAAIEEFLRSYEQRQDFYARVAEHCGRQLERLLREANIRSITSSRAKKLTSLRDKLEQRNSERSRSSRPEYGSVAEILEEIPDLAGARVALYFPRDAVRVNELIVENFRAAQPVRCYPRDGHPQRGGKKFSGYQATHHRVNLLDNSLGPDEQRYANAVCEIQVASVLMHAWSEVEHDLEYKTLSGPVSEAESALLDQINGLVLAGEIALSQLQESIERRVRQRTLSLRDHYDLANWLLAIESDALAAGGDVDRRQVGQAGYAYRFLKRLGLTDLRALSKFEARLVDAFRNADPAVSLSDALRDVLLVDDPSRSVHLEEAREDAVSDYSDRMPDPDRARSLGSFIQKWQEFEWTVQNVLLVVKENAASRSLQSALRELEVSSEAFPGFQQLQGIRNRVVHDIAAVSDDSLARYAGEVDHYLSSFCALALNPYFVRLEEGWGSSVGDDDEVRAPVAVASRRREIVGVPITTHPWLRSRSLLSSNLLIPNNQYWPMAALVENNGRWTFERWDGRSQSPLSGRRFVVYYDVSEFILDDAIGRGIHVVGVSSTWRTDVAADFSRRNQAALVLATEPKSPPNNLRRFVKGLTSAAY